jgi:hypothetical protein
MIRRLSAWASGTSERGAYVLWWVIGMFALAMMLGLVVDGGGKVHTRQHANFCAEEGARAAGQAVIKPLGMRGIAAVVDPAMAQVEALKYIALTCPGVTAQVIPTGPTTLIVNTQTVYTPKILGMIGVGPQVVTGRALITINRTNNGAVGLP